jgi:hypothetical protein
MRPPYCNVHSLLTAAVLYVNIVENRSDLISTF